MKTILAAIDFSDVTSKVVAHAADLAVASGAKLHVVHAAAPNPDFVGFEAGPQNERDFRAETLSQERAKLEAIASELKASGILTSSALRQGPTAETLLKEARDCGAECIVMGSHGHGALYNLVAGSSTTDLLKRTTIPVLVVPARS